MTGKIKANSFFTNKKNLLSQERKKNTKVITKQQYPILLQLGKVTTIFLYDVTILEFKGFKKKRIRCKIKQLIAWTKYRL